MATNLGTLGNIRIIGRGNEPARRFWQNVHQLHSSIIQNPTDLSHKPVIATLIDKNPYLFQGGIPHEVQMFGVAPTNASARSGRLRFLKHLLETGFPIPDVCHGVDPARFSDKVVSAVVSDYFYESSLAFLLAARNNPKLLLLLTTSIPGKYEWVLTWRDLEPGRIGVKYGLTFMDDRLSFVEFSSPIRAHYLYPIDSYYKKGRQGDLLTRATPFSIPMPGSIPIRQIADSKNLYHEIFADIPGLNFPAEIALGKKHNIESKIQSFTQTNDLSSIFIKPIDGFGGEGAASFKIPAGFGAAIEHAQRLLDGHRGFLVQERLMPVPLVDDQKEWNVRQYALWTEDGIKSCWKRFRVGATGGPINTMIGASSHTEKQLLAMVDLTDVQKSALRAKIAKTDKIGEYILERTYKYLSRNYAHIEQRYYGSGSSFQPGLISIDLIVQKEGDEFKTYFLEINDHGSGGIYSYEMIHHLEEFGQSPLVDCNGNNVISNSLTKAIIDMMVWHGRNYKAYLLAP